MARRILITGGLGNLGRKLRSHLEAQGYADIIGFDRAEGADLAGDISVYDEAWAKAFAGVDCVFHFAAAAAPDEPWQRVIPVNIVGTQNVLKAMKRYAPGARMVFASTNHVMGAYRFREGPVTPDMPPGPFTPYGISKYVGEQFCRAYVTEGCGSAIALRIGYCQQADNIPGPHMHMGLWGQQMWLSNGDFVAAGQGALEAPDVGFAVLNLMSDNPGMRWDLSETRRVIGYRPQDGHRPVITDSVRADDERSASGVLHSRDWLDDLSPWLGF
jgi:NAD+ dependent glucose-6-phosphate dehydrogenase